jgi:hypothetical protein
MAARNPTSSAAGSTEDRENVEFDVLTLLLGAPNCPALGLWLIRTLLIR